MNFWGKSLTKFHLILYGYLCCLQKTIFQGLVKLKIYMYWLLHKYEKIVFYFWEIFSVGRVENHHTHLYTKSQLD